MNLKKDETLNPLETLHSASAQRFVFTLHNRKKAVVKLVKKGKGTDVNREVIAFVQDKQETVVFDATQVKETVLYPRACQGSNGTIFVVFAHGDLTKNEQHDIPTNMAILVFESLDEGQTWQQITRLASDPAEFPTWSGLWQPFITELNDGSLALVATEQKHREQPQCQDTGFRAHRDDTLVLFKSFDKGRSWPSKRRVYVGPCGTDNNEGSLVETKEGTLLLAFHSKERPRPRGRGKEGDVKVMRSDDGGETWQEPTLLVEGKDGIDKRLPTLILENSELKVAYVSTEVKKGRFQNPEVQSRAIKI